MKDFALAVLNFVLGLLENLIRGMASFLVGVSVTLIGKFIEILSETKTGKIILLLLGLNFFVLSLILIEIVMSGLSEFSLIQKTDFGEQLRVAVEAINSMGIKSWGREALKFIGPVSLAAVIAELGFSYRRKKEICPEISKSKDVA